MIQRICDKKGLTFATGGCVGSEYRFLGTRILELGQKSAGDLKTGDLVALWQLEAEPLGVVVDDLDILEQQ